MHHDNFVVEGYMRGYLFCCMYTTLLHNLTMGNVSKLLLEIQNMSFLVEWLGSQAKYLDISNCQSMLGE